MTTSNRALLNSHMQLQSNTANEIIVTVFAMTQSGFTKSNSVVILRQGCWTYKYNSLF